MAAGIAYQALTLADKEDSMELSARINELLGHIFLDKGLYDKALEAYSSALDICSRNDDDLARAGCMNNIGIAYQKINVYSLALKNFLYAAAMFSENHDTQGLARSLNNIGMTYCLQDDADRAMQYFNDVLDLSADSLGLPLRAETYANIGFVFSCRGDLHLAVDFSRRALEIYLRLKDEYHAAVMHNRLGDLYMQAGDYEAALGQYDAAMVILEHRKYYKKLAETFLLKARIQSATGDFGEAVQLANQSITIAYKHGFRNLLADSYLLLSELYTANDDVHSAYAYFRQYSIMRDSLLNEKVIQAIADSEIRNEFIRHDIEVENIARDKQLKKYTRWFAIVILILSGLSVILAYSKLASQRKATRILEHQRNILKQTLLDQRISEEKYRALFSPANDAISLMDHEIFVDYNDKTMEIFECTREEIINHPPYNFSPAFQPDGKSSKEKAQQLIRECIDGKAQRFYWLHNRKDGTLFDAEVSLNTIELEGKLYIQAIVRDISERVRAEREMVKAREKAEKATESKTFFLAKMSHEIRTMLGGITSSVQLLLSTKVDKQQKELLDIIDTSAGNLLAIVNEILDLSKIEAGKVYLEEHPFNLRKAIETSINAYQAKAKEKKIALFLSIHHKVPEWVSGDVLRLSQILANLLSNAIKFTNEGSVTLDVVVARSPARSPLVVFRVCDTGIGIPGNKIDDLFSEYSQSDLSISRRFGGTGLGLNIVYRLVMLMEGSIEAESEVNKGTCFTVRIPFRKAEPVAVEAADGKADPATGNRKYRILLAEDNVINQKITMINLRNLGHTVDLAVNGNEAWRLYNENPYDIILMDIQMPEMDGIEVTRLIRQFEASNPSKARTRIVALTANILQQDMEYCLAEGMDAYISKPFSIDDVIAKLEP